MGKINLQKAIIGGLVAGVVLNVVDFITYGVVLKDDMAAAMAALGKPAVSDSMILLFVGLDFVVGVFLVWLYAAIRPRFGPGPATAVKAGLAVWFIAGLMHALFEAPMGLMPTNLIVISTAVMLVACPLAAVVGAKFYTEGAGAGAGAGAGMAGMGSRM
ncbi:MAG: hypothetical protein Q8Q14_17135 [Gemmatimonadales bacterium]|nr:hypothetical protein [Gemmatimonadales bacterium]